MRIYLCRNSNDLLITNHVPNVSIESGELHFSKESPNGPLNSGNKGIVVYPDAFPQIPTGKIVALDI